MTKTKQTIFDIRPSKKAIRDDRLTTSRNMYRAISLMLFAFIICAISGRIALSDTGALSFFEDAILILLTVVSLVATLVAFARIIGTYIDEVRPARSEYRKKAVIDKSKKTFAYINGSKQSNAEKNKQHPYNYILEATVNRKKHQIIPGYGEVTITFLNYTEKEVKPSTITIQFVEKPFDVVAQIMEGEEKPPEMIAEAEKAKKDKEGVEKTSEKQSN